MRGSAGDLASAPSSSPCHAGSTPPSARVSVAAPHATPNHRGRVALGTRGATPRCQGQGAPAEDRLPRSEVRLLVPKLLLLSQNYPLLPCSPDQGNCLYQGR